jgi:prolyl-tRNA synthetase
MSDKTAISPKRSENYAEWYQEVIKAADLAENSPVRGCMVIKPYGYALWENMQSVLDAMFKETGHVNAYFPTLIPLSFLEKEAEHVEGFAKECAVVTHHRLKAGPDGKLQPDPESKLEEPHVLRPTSETIIGHMYAKWVQSYRDLPVLMNQWANVFRWEMRTRMFLRTSEFLWQEGHTVHETSQEAMSETLQMLNIYEKFAQEHMAMPVIKGIKTPDERFAGAVETFTIEALTQDKKAVQAGTSHFLGQNFAKASGIKFQSRQGVQETAWTTSWGVSTRLIGALIMNHADDDGLVLPPRLAPFHVVLIPIYKTDAEKETVLSFLNTVNLNLKKQIYDGKPVRTKVDDRDIRGGDRAWQAIKQGIPIRVEIGPRDVAKNEVFIGTRNKLPKDKFGMNAEIFVAKVPNLLEEIQNSIFERAKKFLNENIFYTSSLVEFEKIFTVGENKKNQDTSADIASSEIGSGFVCVHWHPDAMGHELLGRLKVTPRCIPLDFPKQEGICIFTGKPSTERVLFAKSY